MQRIIRASGMLAVTVVAGLFTTGTASAVKPPADPTPVQCQRDGWRVVTVDGTRFASQKECQQAAKTGTLVRLAEWQCQEIGGSYVSPVSIYRWTCTAPTDSVEQYFAEELLLREICEVREGGPGLVSEFVYETSPPGIATYRCQPV